MKSKDSVYETLVPANSSRYFGCHEDAIKEPRGEVKLVYDDVHHMFYNSQYQPNLIQLDSHQNTQTSFNSASQFEQSLGYFQSNSIVLKHLTNAKSIIEIGCGQGELVNGLRSKGFPAVGFDPVARIPSDFIFPEMYQFQQRADIYILRCVLPHIENPFNFLDKLEILGESLVLIEYQDLDFMILNGLWNRISHDHVNIFTEYTFKSRYEILVSGNYNPEWRFALVRLKKRRCSKTTNSNSKYYKTEVSKLTHVKSTFLEYIKDKSQIIIYGGAGTGAILGFALKLRGCNVLFAVDLDSSKHGLYMECSGIQVRDANSITNSPKEAVICVANPAHILSAKSFAGNRLVIPAKC